MDTELNIIAITKKDLSNEERTQFDLQYNSRRINPNTALIFSFLLGGIGVDRFYIGDTGKGIGKLLTLGGIGIWALVDLFLIRRATRAKNSKAIHEIKEAMLNSRPR